MVRARSRTNGLHPSDVAAVLVTRGDVDLDPILASLPYGEVIIWDNSKRESDLAAYGRYAAIAEASAEVIYVQDDDCIVSDHDRLLAAYEDGKLVANMPRARLDYTDTVLIGWGALFRRDLPAAAFARYSRHYPVDDSEFHRIGADFIFPIMTPWKRIDVGLHELSYHQDVTRTSHRAGYEAAKREYLRRGRELRDAPPPQRHYYRARRCMQFAANAGRAAVRIGLRRR